MEGTCCPFNTQCTVNVTQTDHPAHWQTLDNCNGQTTCSVNAEQVAGGGCNTDYEIVTYRCVSQGWSQCLHAWF